MKGRAPNASVTGFHWVETRKPRPNFSRDGAELIQSSYTASSVTNRIKQAKVSTTRRAMVSPVCARWRITGVWSTVGVVMLYRSLRGPPSLFLVCRSFLARRGRFNRRVYLGNLQEFFGDHCLR